jgi:hypothetical protein
MATVKVVDLIRRAQAILQDTTGTRWPVLELQDWLNDAYKEIILVRPDANTQTGTFTCATGSRQKLSTGFPNALRLIEITRNVAATSTKRAVRLIDRKILDDQRPAWHAETASVDIQHYMFDVRLPKEFFVYPPALPAAQLEVVYSAVPVRHSLSEAQLGDLSTAETIRLDDNYGNAILDYMLYRAYSKDADYAANGERAVGHFTAMQAALSGGMQMDIQSRPGTGEAGRPQSLNPSGFSRVT